VVSAAAKWPLKAFCLNSSTQSRQSANRPSGGQSAREANTATSFLTIRSRFFIGSAGTRSSLPHSLIKVAVPVIGIIARNRRPTLALERTSARRAGRLSCTSTERAAQL